MTNDFKMITRLYRGTGKMDCKLMRRWKWRIWLEVGVYKTSSEAQTVMGKLIGDQGGSCSFYTQVLPSPGGFLDEYKVMYDLFNGYGLTSCTEVYYSSLQARLHKWVYERFESDSKRNVRIVVDTVKLPNVKRRKK